MTIDRTDPRELNIVQDPMRYTKSQIEDLLAAIDDGNRASGGMMRNVEFYGIFGFIRFREGFYMILITERERMGMIGRHYVYRVADTALRYIPHPSVRVHSPDEGRYVTTFSKMELVHDFFFSYTYDITHTLQYNMTRHRAEEQSTARGEPLPTDPRFPFAENVVWNHYLLRALLVADQPVREFILPVIHGFFQQARFSTHGRVIQLTVVARRSRHYAGTRYLRRGINLEGKCANEVEIEQMMHEVSTGTSDEGNFTSFVQIRGSIPLFWSQDNSGMVPKPPIILHQTDPFFSATALHFEDLMARYGAPVLVVNLVKEREKIARESLLLKEYGRSIEFINQFLPPEYAVRYHPWDMTRAVKSKTENVMEGLAVIAAKAIAVTGFFHSGAQHDHYDALDDGQAQGCVGGVRGGWRQGREQRGVVRVNCIDSLDRTNACQFCIGRGALGHQMFAMGLTASPTHPLSEVVADSLRVMYEAMGDAIALQYGGSQLNHTMDTYEGAGWSAMSRDMFTAVRRYYSNSFTDAEKQAAINLLLGVSVEETGDLAAVDDGVTATTTQRGRVTGPLWSVALNVNALRYGSPLVDLSLVKAHRGSALAASLVNDGTTGVNPRTAQALAATVSATTAPPTPAPLYNDLTRGDSEKWDLINPDEAPHIDPIFGQYLAQEDEATLMRGRKPTAVLVSLDREDSVVPLTPTTHGTEMRAMRLEHHLLLTPDPDAPPKAIPATATTTPAVTTTTAADATPAPTGPTASAPTTPSLPVAAVPSVPSSPPKSVALSPPKNLAVSPSKAGGGPTGTANGSSAAAAAAEDGKQRSRPSVGDARDHRRQQRSGTATQRAVRHRGRPARHRKRLPNCDSDSESDYEVFYAVRELTEFETLLGEPFFTNPRDEKAGGKDKQTKEDEVLDFVGRTFRSATEIPAPRAAAAKRPAAIVGVPVEQSPYGLQLRTLDEDRNKFERFTAFNRPLNEDSFMERQSDFDFNRTGALAFYNQFLDADIQASQYTGDPTVKPETFYAAYVAQAGSTTDTFGKRVVRA